MQVQEGENVDIHPHVDAKGYASLVGEGLHGEFLSAVALYLEQSIHHNAIHV